MSAGKYSFTINQGATLSFEVQYRDSVGDPIDLTGYTGLMQIRSNFSGSGITYVTFNSLSGSQYEDGFPSGSAFLSFSGSDLNTPPTSGSIGVYAGWEVTNALDFDNQAFYDLEITSGSIRIRLLEGQVKLSKQVTD
jgi:hypothetical protein